MNAKITLFLLFFIHILTHGMFNHDILSNPDILSCITAKLCFVNKYNPLQIKNNIKNLTLTNKFFCNYYAKEEIKQDIIKSCSLFNNSNDYDTANILGCHTIKNTIDYFICIAQKNNLSFTPEDLKQTWYLNTTTFISKRALPCNQSLLYIALDHAYDTPLCNLEKVKAIINNSPNFDFLYGEGQNVLSRICFLRYFINYYLSEKSPLLDGLLKIAKSILDKQMLPDGHTRKSQHTPLMLAKMNKDEPLARLLLEYGADPYARTYQSMVGAPEQCAFDMNQGISKELLEKLVHEVEMTKKTYK